MYHLNWVKRNQLQNQRKQSKKLLQDGRTEEIEKLDEKIAGLVNKSEKTGVPYSILKKSYDRGMDHMEGWT